jgi:ribose/xylose/arabinose/galactoside ABC-type transport system permease subunit
MKHKKLVIFLVDNLIWILLVITIVLFTTLNDKFISKNNIVNILIHAAPLGVMVVGQSFTLITGNFDLSSESILGVSAMLAAFLIAPVVANGSGLISQPLLAVPIMLLVGLFVGWLNGLLITRVKMNNFIVTLAMLIIFRGAVLLINDGLTISKLPDSFKALGHDSVFGFPISVLVMLSMFGLAHIVTKYTQFGRDLFAVGGKYDSALSSGIDPAKRIRQVYLISGALAGFAAWIMLGRLGVAVTNLGQGMIFEMQAAAVIGGISLFGGRGSMIGALAGVILLSSIDSGLSMIRVSSFWIDTIRGLIILLAMFIDAQKVRQNGEKYGFGIFSKKSTIQS